MATKQEWESLGPPYYFRPHSSDQWGDPDKMNFHHLRLVNAFRRYIGRPIVVTHGFGDSSVANGRHPHGDAIDCFIINMDPFEAFKEIVTFHTRLVETPFVKYFTGIGVYLDVWKYHGILMKCGFHLDSRPDVIPAVWGALPPLDLLTTRNRDKCARLYAGYEFYPGTNKQKYVPMDQRFWEMYQSLRP